MACLALISASNLRAATSTFPNNKSKPCEHWPARCMHPGVGPWPLPCQKNTNKCSLQDSKANSRKENSLDFSCSTRYRTLRSAIWSVICPSAFAVPSMSFLSFPAHSSPTLPASSRITRRATSPRSPGGRDTRQDHIVEEKKKVESDVFSRVWQKIQLPGCPWGSFNQLLAWPIFDSIKARDLFKASIS